MTAHELLSIFFKLPKGEMSPYDLVVWFAQNMDEQDVKDRPADEVIKKAYAMAREYEQSSDFALKNAAVAMNHMEVSEVIDGVKYTLTPEKKYTFADFMLFNDVDKIAENTYQLCTAGMSPKPTEEQFSQIPPEFAFASFFLQFNILMDSVSGSVEYLRIRNLESTK